MIFMKYFIALSIILTIISCNSNTDIINEDTSQSPDMIIIDQEQLEAGKIEMGQLKEEVFSDIVYTNGTFTVPPENKVVVSAYFEGYVKNVSILEGDKVKKGQVLFSLENPEYIKIQEEYLETKALQKSLEAEYSRQKTLYKENVSSEKTFLSAESRYLSNKTKYFSLAKQLKMMHIAPESLKPENIKSNINVYAPLSGFITDIKVSNGSFISPSNIALKIVNTDHLHLELAVYEKKLNSIKIGQKVKFSLLDQKDKEYNAEIIQVGKNIDSESRTIRVHAHLESDSLIKYFTVGMYVDARIYIDYENLISLPNEAIVEVDGISYALVLDNYNRENDNYTFKTVKIKTGRKSDDYTQIINFDEFDKGSKFITNGAFNLIKD